jgi:hypothetical protein
MRLLYVGADAGTSGYRIRALRRLGHDVRVLDAWAAAPRFPGFAQWCFRTGWAGVAEVIARRLLGQLGNERFDLAWVESGEFAPASFVRALHKHAPYVVNYNHDDPFGPRDAMRFRHYRAGVPEYDLVVVVRDCNVAEAKRAGARRVLHVFRSSDEVAHAARILSEDDRRRWSSEVAFIGTWMPERGAFMQALVARGVPLSIFGNGWQKAHEWRDIRSAWRGPAADAEEDYVRAVQCAKICLGLLSKANRDLHTTRSLEIPAIGSLFLAERTPEHSLLYKEDVEAVFWSDAAECAEKCHALLADDARRLRIAAAGHARARANAHTNEKALAQIIDAVVSATSPGAVHAGA